MNNALVSTQIIKDGNMGANIQSAVINCGFLINHSIQFTWIGNAVGDFDVQITNNTNITGPYARTDADWVDVTFAVQPAAAGVAASVFENLTDLRCAAMRFKFTRTSGTGTLQAFYSAINK